MWCWHKWSKWEEYSVTIKMDNLEKFYLSLLDPKIKEDYDTRMAQVRRCEKCGLTQRKWV